MKQTLKLLQICIVIFSMQLFSGCSKVNNLKTEDPTSSFLFKNKSTEQLNSDELLKYSINDKSPVKLVYDKQMKVNLDKDFINNQINIKIWAENTNGIILSNINNLNVTKEIFLQYKTASISYTRSYELRTSVNNSSSLPGGGKIIIGSGMP